MFENKFDQLFKYIISQQFNTNDYFGSYKKLRVQAFPILRNCPDYWDSFLINYTKPTLDGNPNTFQLTNDACNTLMGYVPEVKPIFKLKLSKFKTKFNYYPVLDNVYIEDPNKKDPLNLIGKTEFAIAQQQGQSIPELFLIYTKNMDTKQCSKISNYILIYNSHFSVQEKAKWTDQLIKTYLPDFNKYNSVFQDFIKKYTRPYYTIKQNIALNTFLLNQEGMKKYHASSGTKWTIVYNKAIFDNKTLNIQKDITFILAQTENVSKINNNKYNSYILTNSSEQPQNDNDIRMTYRFF